jgi:hypothetical protein
MAADWSARKDDVLQQLRFLEASELAEICTSSNIVIPPTKTGNRNAIHTLIMRHINSEAVEDSTDQGLQLFTEMDTQLKQILSNREEDDDKTVVSTGEVAATVLGSNY